MNPQWEYLRVVWDYRRNRVPNGRRATGGLKEGWSYDSVFLISRPGSKTPEAWHPVSSWHPDPAPSSSAVREMLNGLGAEGWEMVSQTALETTVEPDGDPQLPYTAGPVIALEWTFKRRKLA